MGTGIETLGVFETGLLTDLQAGDLDLLGAALTAEGVEDEALFEAIGSRDTSLVAKLLGDEKRRNIFLRARFQVSRLFRGGGIRHSRASGNPVDPRFCKEASLSAFLYYGGAPVQLAGAGNKRNPAPATPTYPVFNLKDFEGQPLGEMVEAARRFHEQASYMRPPGFSRFATAAQREAITEIQSTHRRMAALLALGGDPFPLEEKGMLVRLFHGEKGDVRKHLEKLLKTLSVEGLRAEIKKIERLGFSAPIDLATEMKAQDLRRKPEIQNLIGRWLKGEIALAVVSSAELAGGVASLKAISQAEGRNILSELLEAPAFRAAIKGPGAEKIVGAAFFGLELVEEVGRTNMARVHVSDLSGFTVGLKRAMDRLVTPHIGEVETQRVFKKLGDEGARAFLGMLRHGTITIPRAVVKKYYDYFLRLSQSQAPGRAEDYFPVVVVAPIGALQDGFIDLSRAAAVDYYVLRGDAEKLKVPRGTVHPFFPFPESNFPGIPKAFLIEALFLMNRNEAEMVERLAQSEEGNGGRNEAGFPEGAVRGTRNFHHQPSHYIRQGTDDLERQLVATERRHPGQRNPLHERDRLVLRFMRDDGIPLELKAAMRDLYTVGTGSHVDPLLDSVLHRYAEEGTTKLADLSRELFAGYFLHLPWAWEIMVEEWLKRELVWGFANQAPLGVMEVPKESRKEAWEFAWAATHLMGFSKEQVVSILKTAATLARGEDPRGARQRFALLGRLALPTDDGAFEFLRRYRAEEDLGGVRLRLFLGKLDLKGSEEERRWRFQSAIFRSSSSYPPLLRRVEGDLLSIVQELAGSDPVHLWDIQDAVLLLTYHLAENLELEKALLSLRNIAVALGGWRQWNSNGKKREEDDPLTKEIRALLEPSHLADTLRALAMTFGSELLAPHLIDLLKRQSGNLHTLQYLLAAFHLKVRLNLSERQFVRLFEQEKRITDLENGNGKIRNDPYLKYALYDLLPTHLAPPIFAMAMERRVASQFAGQEAVAVVEVLPETWTESVVDFRIHLKDGQTFLVEVKTHFYDGKNFAGLLDSVREQVRKAAWQLKWQYRSGQNPSRQDQIIVYIQTPSGLRLVREQMERLYEKAAHAVANNGFQFKGMIRIEQDS